MRSVLVSWSDLRWSASIHIAIVKAMVSKDVPLSVSQKKLWNLVIMNILLYFWKKFTLPRSLAVSVVSLVRRLVVINHIKQLFTGIKTYSHLFPQQRPWSNGHFNWLALSLHASKISVFYLILSCEVKIMLMPRQIYHLALSRLYSGSPSLTF